MACTFFSLMALHCVVCALQVSIHYHDGEVRTAMDPN
jgi:hypothetical protein